MSENKTKPTHANVPAFLGAVDDVERPNDCHALLAMIGKITGKPAVIWGAGDAERSRAASKA